MPVLTLAVIFFSVVTVALSVAVIAQLILILVSNMNLLITVSVIGLLAFQTEVDYSLILATLAGFILIEYEGVFSR